MTASADYGVTIAEDFTPPASWLPGQTIEKNVGVVNTGNIDAFVRTWLEGEMDVLAEKRDTAKLDTATDTTFKDSTVTVLDSGAVYTKDASDSDKDTVAKTGTGAYSLNKTTDDNLNKLGLTYSYDNSGKVYLKELDTTIYHNPNDPTAATNNPADFNEVMSVQAGGVLAYLETNPDADATYFYYKPNNSNTFKSEKGNTYEVNGNTEYKVVKVGTTNAFTVAGDDIEVTGTTIIVKDEDAIIKYLGNHIDSDNFYPATTGLYVFRRNSNKDATSSDPTTSNYEFSGYYYVKSTTEDGIKAASGTVGTDYKTSAENTFALQGKYFALQYDKNDTQKSDYVLEKDTYTVTRDDDGNVTFYPYATPATWDNDDDASTDDITIYKIGSDYYGADGKKLSILTTAQPVVGTQKSVTLFTAQEKVIENNKLVWKYYQNTKIHNGKAYYTDGTNWKPVGSDTALDATNAVESAIITALGNANNYANTKPMYVVSDDFGSGLKVDIQLDDNVLGAGTYKALTSVAATADGTHTANAETWTRIVDTESSQGSDLSDPSDDTPKHDTFYYNNDLEEGATTARLVDSVTLDGTVTQYDFIAFDFDLNVFSDSVQVTPDSNGVETTTNVRAWAAIDGDNGSYNNDGHAVAATGTRNGDTTPTTTEIEFVNWATT